MGRARSYVVIKIGSDFQGLVQDIKNILSEKVGGIGFEGNGDIKRKGTSTFYVAKDRTILNFSYHHR